MILAVDTETTGLSTYHGCRPFMVTACDGEENYFWEGEVNPYTREVYWSDDDLLDMKLMFDKADKLVFHNTGFDYRMLNSIGFKMEQYWNKTEDTLIAAHVINAAKNVENKSGKKEDVGRSHSLKDLAIEYFGYFDDDEVELEEAVRAARASAPHEYLLARKGAPFCPGVKKNFHKMDYWLVPDECRIYACNDVERTFLLWKAFKRSMIGDSLWQMYLLRKDLLRICYEMTNEGVYCDKQGLTDYINTLTAEMEALRWEVKGLAGIKYKIVLSKSAHIADLLHNYLGVPVLYRSETGRPSVNKESLDLYFKRFESPAITKVNLWKQKETKKKYATGYLDFVTDDSRIHHGLNPTGTRETRQSSNSPNMQNVTGELEQYFPTPEGYVVLDADLDNIEMRIWAYAVNNPELVELFNAGKSYHYFVFKELFPREFEAYMEHKDDKEFMKKTPRGRELAELYRKIKEVNFGIQYGSSGKAADDKIGIPGTYDRLIKRVPEIQIFTDSLIQQVYDNIDKWGLPCIFTGGGYRLPVPLDAPYKACNYYVQGTAGMITTRAMQRIRWHEDYRDSNSKMFNQVHDSLKIKIPLIPEHKQLAQTFVREMELAGEEFIPKCTASYQLHYPVPS